MKKVIISLLIIIIAYLLLTKDKTVIDQQEISLEQESIYRGDLVLINRESGLQEHPTNLTAIPQNIASNVSVDSEHLIQEHVLAPLWEMFTAAENDGILHFTINSAYRSGLLQQQLYEENGADYALPAGYSEHQTGLSLDIGSKKGTMHSVNEGKWLAENAARFGFILRYPENKTDITGIAFEPWHFRYVGLPHSMMMAKKDFVFEEYVNYLRDKKEYTMKINDVTYFVQYVEQQPFAKIPESQSFKISGDNINGFIITSIIQEK